MSHSFVRGNWRNEASSAPMILAKCCHDLDILVWLTGSTVSKLSCFGSLAHYRSQNAPPGAPLRCTDGCPIEQECIWYAPKLYDAAPAPGPDSGGHNFMKFALGGEQTRQGRWETLKTSRFGRCVYHCDNDVVDRQTINMLFENDITCTFTMHGHSEREGRTMRWDGTHATLHGEFGENQFLRIVDHGTLKEEIIHIEADESGHGGGDTGLIRDFIDAMHGKTSSRQTTARVSLESHLLCFAAEESRHSGQTINMADYR
jgi:predicted dehydrogenase